MKEREKKLMGEFKKKQFEKIDRPNSKGSSLTTYESLEIPTNKETNIYLN